MKYAYRDKYGIIHVLDNKANAEARAAGEVKEVEVPAQYGYPCIYVDGKLQPIFDYGNGEIYVDGNVWKGKHISKVDYEIRSKVDAVLQAIGL